MEPCAFGGNNGEEAKKVNCSMCFVMHYFYRLTLVLQLLIFYFIDYSN